MLQSLQTKNVKIATRDIVSAIGATFSCLEMGKLHEMCWWGFKLSCSQK